MIALNIMLIFIWHLAKRKQKNVGPLYCTITIYYYIVCTISIPQKNVVNNHNLTFWNKVLPVPVGACRGLRERWLSGSWRRMNWTVRKALQICTDPSQHTENQTLWKLGSIKQEQYKGTESATKVVGIVTQHLSPTEHMILNSRPLRIRRETVQSTRIKNWREKKGGEKISIFFKLASDSANRKRLSNPV